MTGHMQAAASAGIRGGTGDVPGFADPIRKGTEPQNRQKTHGKTRELPGTLRMDTAETTVETMVNAPEKLSERKN